jgi:hypothetical protein
LERRSRRWPASSARLPSRRNAKAECRWTSDRREQRRLGRSLGGSSEHNEYGTTFGGREHRHRNPPVEIGRTGRNKTHGYARKVDRQGGCGVPREKERACHSEEKAKAVAAPAMFRFATVSSDYIGGGGGLAKNTTIRRRIRVSMDAAPCKKSSIGVLSPRLLVRG